MKKILILLVGISLILSSCGSKKKAIATKPTTQTTSKKEITVSEPTEVVVKEANKSVINSSSKLTDTQLYINQYAKIAIEEMEIYKIPASITLAQGILESSSGNSELTKKSNNHFGIKCHQKWTGARTYHDDDEEGECFRVYKEAASSFKDHSEFLNGRRRYSFLFNLDKGDYVSWARGLRQAGYATDNQYPQKLIRIIERYKLYQYDKEVLGDDYEKEGKNTLSHLVKKGETLYSIGDFYSISVAKLMKINHLTSSTLFVGQRITLRSESISDDSFLSEETGTNGQVVTTGINGKTATHHIVKQKETLFAISRKYKLSLKKLKEYNNLSSCDINIGQQLFLEPVDKSLLAATKNKVVAQEKSADNKKHEEVIVAKEKTVTSKVQVDQDSIAYHLVKQKETLFGISRKYKLSLKKLKKYNNLSSCDINIGQKLYLAKADKSLLGKEKAVGITTDNKDVSINSNKEVAKVEEEVVLEVPEIKETNITPVKQETIVVAIVEDVVPTTKENIEVDLPMKTISKNETPPDFHTVKEGETLYAIAYKYNLEIPMFRKINRLKTDNISVGQHLRLRKGAVLPKTATSASYNTKNNRHTVVKGDTLYSIATRNLLTIERLKQLNNLDGNTITIGQVLVLE